MTIESSFNRFSTAGDVIRGHDLRGRAVIVTGGAGGLGLEAVRALASAGADVTVTARDAPAARQSLAAAGLDVEVASMDLSQLTSVRAFAEQWGGRPLNILINNAGVMQVPLGATIEGFERHIGINHLGHFLLTLLLTPALQSASNSRVVSVSSSAHRLSPWNAADPFWRERTYDPAVAYGESKSANALFALDYDRRHAHIGIRAFSLMPGVIVTPLMRHIAYSDVAALTAKMHDVVKTPQQGASTIVWAAIGSELSEVGGLYLEDCAEARAMNPAIPGVGVAAHVCEEERATALWNWSIEQCERVVSGDDLHV